MSLHFSKNIMQSNKKDKWVSPTLLPFYFTSIPPSLFPFYYFPTPSSHPSREVASSYPLWAAVSPLRQVILGATFPVRILLTSLSKFIHSYFT